jgi:hypothetical protein
VFWGMKIMKPEAKTMGELTKERVKDGIPQTKS